ncbi:uncharacterized protein RSE6_15124 [Rhynchosporium secalis]|uniref:Uncharacterized protein n=1 Tax=Rhynchosporium secalis TaxID=38038 RepID=A0A1E1MWR8_RHYSE|nr:uncharacterized protein RSE6_15124 [Rhynchosporium secalis]
MVHASDTLYDLEGWAQRKVLWVENLSKLQVFLELRGIMEGHSYSWHCINEFLQARFDEGSLEISPVDGDILFEWNNLCDEKRTWEKTGHLSINDAGFNMDCLINLMILPFQAGLGNEVRRLVTRNIDKPNVSTVDLGVGPGESESLRYRTGSWFMTDGDTSSSESEDSEYVDDEVETDDEGVKHLDEGVGDLDEGESDEARYEDKGVGSGYESLSENGSDEEKSDYFGDSSLESEVEIDDEDIEGLGVKVVDIDDDDEISDFLL